MVKIYDCFMFFNELDLLEIRLNILDPYVDFFVLCESLETFSGKEKPLYYLENKERFAKWNHKIIHRIEGYNEASNAFERAALQKDSIRDSIKNLNPDDVVYYGDVDEIWKPQEVGEKVYKLRQKCYSYYLNIRSSEDWQGTNVCKYKNLCNLNELRANHDNLIADGGWHFTNMGGAEQIRNKLEAYDHQEFNSDQIKEKIEERMENGEDYVGRKFDWQGNPFVFHTSDIDLPEYLKYNRDAWKKLFK